MSYTAKMALFRHIGCRAMSIYYVGCAVGPMIRQYCDCVVHGMGVRTGVQIATHITKVFVKRAILFLQCNCY